MRAQATHPPTSPHQVVAKNKDGYSAVHIAASEGHAALIDTLVRIHAAPLSDVTSAGLTVLHLAALASSGAAMAMVLGFPSGLALLDVRDASGDTALHCVASAVSGAQGGQAARDGATRNLIPET